MEKQFEMTDVGVPVIRPFDVFNDKPLGKDPCVTAYEEESATKGGISIIVDLTPMLKWEIKGNNIVLSTGYNSN